MSISNVEYRPYRSHAWFIPFSAMSGIFAYIVAGAALPSYFVAAAYLGMGLLCTVLTKFLYDSAQTTISFESRTLNIASKKCNPRKFTLGKELAFGYYSRNYKGNLFLVLSPASVDQKQLKKIVNQSANRSKVCIGNVIVIYMDDLQDTARIKEIVFATVPFIVNE